MSSVASTPLPASATAAATGATPPSARVVSIDALRGFDMFWILGGDALVHALARTWDIAPLRVLRGQFEHKAWDGFAFYDLIFPLFIFVAGVSLVFSLTRSLEQKGRAATVKHVLWRGALLFVIGIVYSGGFTTAWPDIRLLGVLQRIALAYTGAALLFCFLKPRALVAAAAILLGGYWALMALVPIRDIQLENRALTERLGVEKPTLAQARQAYDATTAHVTGRFEPGYNVSNHFDFEHLPGHLYNTYWDPEGIVSTLPAIATCLLGVFAGFLLRRKDRTDQQKLAWLIVGGVAALAVGWLWHLEFPVIKKIWTSSYVLVAGGWSLLLLAAFYWLVDVRQWRGWCRPFVWIGMNAITLYLASNLLGGYRKLALRFAGTDVKAFFDTHFAAGFGDVVIAATGIALMLWLASFLHQRKIFLRV
jgi:predicted acyltransferase